MILLTKHVITNIIIVNVLSIELYFQFGTIFDQNDNRLLQNNGCAHHHFPFSIMISEDRIRDVDNKHILHFVLLREMLPLCMFSL